jgi:hypothetical protein
MLLSMMMMRRRHQHMIEQRSVVELNRQWCKRLLNRNWKKMHLPARAHCSGTVYVYAALWTLNYLYLATGDTVNRQEMKK